MVATVTIYVGLFYLTDDVTNNGRLFLLSLLIIANLYFLIFWLYKMFYSGLNLIRDKIPALQKCLGKSGIKDGYGDELTVRMAQPAHYYKMGKVIKYSLVEKLEETVHFDKSIHIPGTVTELALIDLEKIAETDIPAISECDNLGDTMREANP